MSGSRYHPDNTVQLFVARILEHVPQVGSGEKQWMVGAAKMVEKTRWAPKTGCKWGEITPISRGYNSSYQFLRTFIGAIIQLQLIGAHLVFFYLCILFGRFLPFGENHFLEVESFRCRSIFLKLCPNIMGI